MTATMLPKSTSNGQPRKQLADQIDRLDQILTGLSEGLDERINEAVQQAVVFAVRQAVQTTLTEVLTNPDLAARMQHSTPHVETAAAPAATTSTVVTGVRATISHAWQWACRGIGRFGKGVVNRVVAVKQKAQAAFHGANVLWAMKKQILLALGIGVVMAGVTYLATPWLAATLTGLCSTCTAFGVQASLWLRKHIVNFSMI